MTTESQQNINTQEEDISLKDLILKVGQWWRYLLSKWLIILVFGFIGGALGFTYAYFKKPIYTATTTFVLEDEKSGGGLGNLAGLASMAGVDLGGGGGGIFQGDNILELYKSRKMIERALFTEVKINNMPAQLLINRYIDFNKLRDNWNNNSELANLTFNVNTINNTTRLQDSILSIVVADINKNNLIVSKLNTKSGIIQAEVRAADESFAKNFNHAIVKIVNEFYVTTKTQKASKNISILQHKTDSVRSIMNGAIYTAVAVSDATPNLNPTRQIQRIAPSQKAQFSAETNKAILTEMAKNLELSKLALLKETPLIQVIDEPVYPLKKKYLTNALGVILGGVLFCFFCVLFFGIKYYFRDANS